MAITTPKGEQIQFVSSKTGTHNLDTYLEAAEVGDRQLSDLLDDMFDTSTGVFKADNFQFRYDTSTKALQVRVGQFANSTSSWTEVTPFFSVEGAFSTSTSYKNFDLVLTAAKDLYIVHGQTSDTSYSSESNFISAATTTKIVDVSLAQDWAKKTDGIVDSTDHSSKAWAIGGSGVTDTASKGAAKEWAIETSGTVDTASYSSKEYAQGTQAGTGGSSKSWSQDTDQVNGASTNDRSAKSWAQGSSMTGSTLGGSAKDWAQLTGSTVDGTNYSAKYWATHSNVTTVVSNVSDIQALALKTTELGLLGTTTVVGNLGQLGTSTVVGHMANLNATNVISNIGTVAGISGNVTTVAGANTNIANLNASGVISNIGTVAGISGHVTTVAGIQSQVTAVAGISSEIQTVHTNIAKVQATANDLLETTSEIDTVANAIANVDNVGNNIANVNSVGTNIANVNTVASSISGVNSFGERYRIASSAPSLSLDEGDLYFDTNTNKLNVYDGSNWQSTGEAASRALTSHTVTSAGTQTISVTYTVGLIDVYLNGLHLAPADYTASNGSSVVVTGCSVSDIIDIVALSAFNAANYGTASSKNIGIGTDNVPTFAANVADNDFLKIDGTTVEGRSAAEVRSDLNVADGANAYVHPNHSGEVTSTTDGATVIVDNIVDEANLKISNAGSNGEFLQKQSGNTGGLTWAAVDLSSYAPLASPTLTGNPVAPTQSVANNSTRIATTEYADRAVSNLVDSSPSALNTLNELAAALGDDANFSTTVTNSIATKAPLAGATFTGNVLVDQSGGTVTLDSNGHITGKQKLNVATAGGRLTGTTTQGDMARIDLSQTTNTAHGGYLSFSTANTSGTLTEGLRIDKSQNAIFAGNVDLGDSDLLRFGAGNDLQFHSDGTNGIIRQNNNSGGLYIQADNFVQFGEVNNANPMLKATKDGAVDLYFDYSSYNTPKLSTTSAGVTVSGNVVTTGNLQLGTSGSEEGQVEINSSRLLLRSTGDASGLRFDGSSYTPFKNGSASDGTVDLGFGSGRYKDLYLSGTVNFSTNNHQATGERAQNIHLKTGSTSDYAGLYVTNSDGDSANSMQLFGDANAYGFLNGVWGNWDIKKTRGGAMTFNNTSETVVTSSNIGTYASGSHWTVVSDSTITNQQSTNFTVGADKWYRWIISGLKMQSAEKSLMIKISTDGGSNWASNYNYYSYIWHYNLWSPSSIGVTQFTGSNGGVQITREPLPYDTASGANDGTIQMTIDYYQPSGAYLNMEGRTWGWGNSNSDSNREYLRVKGLSNYTTTVNYIRFINAFSDSSSNYNLTGRFTFLRMD